MSGMGIDLPAGGVVVQTNTIVISIVTGVLVSVASAVFPTRRASKVPPVAALRDVAIDRSGMSARPRSVRRSPDARNRSHTAKVRRTGTSTSTPILVHHTM